MKKIKNSVFSILFIFSALIILTSGILFSYAWFTDSATSAVDGSIQLGKIEMTLGTVSYSSPLTNIIPNSVITNSDLVCSVDSDSQAMYIRARVYITSNSSDPTVTAWLNNISSSMLEQADTYTDSSTYSWYVNEGYCYLVTYTTPAQSTTLKPAEYQEINNPQYKLKTGLKIPSDIEELANNAQTSITNVKLNVEFQSIQCANQEASTFNAIKALFNSTFD